MKNSVAPTTQTAYPWRATARTVFAAVVAFAGMWPVIVGAAGLDEGIEWVSTSVLVTAGITRVMAIPAVDRFIQQFLPFLAAAPNARSSSDAVAAPNA